MNVLTVCVLFAIFLIVLLRIKPKTWTHGIIKMKCVEPRAIEDRGFLVAMTLFLQFNFPFC
jgi:hypothetical protein